MVVVFLILSPIAILLLLIRSKIKKSRELLKQFNFNKNAIDEAYSSSDYKINQGHIYE